MAMTGKEGKIQFWRLLKIDEQIREKLFPTVRSLSKEFEVSKRTIERDIEFLRDMYDAPIAYDHSKKGYYYTQDTFFLKSLFLSADEFFSVAVFEKLLRQYRKTPIEEKLKKVFKKLTELLPKDIISFDSLWLDAAVTFIAEPSPDIEPEIFSTIFEGVKTHHAIKFLYRSLEQEEAVERIAEPYHIVCQRAAWYVIGLCRLRKEPRIFSFSRMQKVRALKKEVFEIPKDFKAEDYIDKNVGVWLTKREPFTVKLLFSPKVSVFAEEHRWSDDQKIKIHRDKSVEVSFPTTQTEEIKRFVLGQGSTVKVLEPLNLVEEVREEIKKMREMY